MPTPQLSTLLSALTTPTKNPLPGVGQTNYSSAYSITPTQVCNAQLNFTPTRALIDNPTSYWLSFGFPGSGPNTFVPPYWMGRIIFWPYSGNVFGSATAPQGYNQDFNTAPGPATVVFTDDASLTLSPGAPLAVELASGPVNSAAFGAGFINGTTSMLPFTFAAQAALIARINMTFVISAATAGAYQEVEIVGDTSGVVLPITKVGLDSVGVIPLVFEYAANPINMLSSLPTDKSAKLKLTGTAVGGSVNGVIMFQV